LLGLPSDDSRDLAVGVNSGRQPDWLALATPDYHVPCDTADAFRTGDRRTVPDIQDHAKKSVTLLIPAMIG